MDEKEEKSEAYTNSDAKPERPSSRPSSNLELGRFGGRVTQLVGSVPVRNFARIVGMDEKSLRNYMDGKTDPSRRALVAIARHTGVTVDWLATGEGPMRPEVTTGHPQVKEWPSAVAALGVRPDKVEDKPGHEAPQNSRLTALTAMLAQLSDQDRGRLLDEFFARAQDAQQLKDLRLAVAELRAAVGK